MRGSDFSALLENLLERVEYLLRRGPLGWVVLCAVQDDLLDLRVDLDRAAARRGVEVLQESRGVLLQEGHQVLLRNEVPGRVPRKHLVGDAPETPAGGGVWNSFREG